MPASHWLLKTEPSTYSFEQLVRDGATRWDGIANPTALANLRRAKKGDVCVIYHTGKDKAAVGLAELVTDAYQHPDPSGAWVIDLRATRPLAKKVTLTTIKADPAFSSSPLVRQGRLSFVPLAADEFARLIELASG